MPSRISKAVLLFLLCSPGTLCVASPTQSTPVTKEHTPAKVSYYAHAPQTVTYDQFLGSIRAIYGRKAAERVGDLYREIKRRPEKDIPELAFLQRHDWAEIAGEKGSSRSSQKHLENTLEKLTILAQRNFLEALSDELRSRPGVRLKSITRTEQLRPFLKDWLIAPNLYELNHYEVVPSPGKPKTTSPDQANSFVPDLTLRTRRTGGYNSAHVAISPHQSQVSSTFVPGK